MNNRSLANLVLYRQDETFIYIDKDGDLIIEQSDDGQVGAMVIIGESNITTFAEAVMALALKPAVS